jgi:phasin family protein
MDTMTFDSLIERMTAANKQLFDATLKFNEIAARAQGRYMRQHRAALETCLDAGKRQMKLATETHDPKDAFALGSELTMELGEKLTSMMRETVEIGVEIGTELQGELQAILEESWKTSQLKPAAAPKKKAAAA